MYLWAVIYIFCFKVVQNKALTRTMHNAAIFHHFTIFALHLFSLLHIFFNWKCFCNCDYSICVNYYHIVCVMVMEKKSLLKTFAYQSYVNPSSIMITSLFLIHIYYILCRSKSIPNNHSSEDNHLNSYISKYFTLII